MFQFSKPPPLSLYVHIPWCVRKCPYCDFNSHQMRDSLPEQAYVDALLVDLDKEIASVEGRTIDTVFIGGGTPSLFSPRSIASLLDAVRDRALLASDAEVTLEVNPGTLEQGKFEAFRSAGVNRLSIGVQSFHSALLQELGRIHDGDEAIAAANSARQAGIENFNLDLMHGLPGQTVDQAMDDLHTAIAQKPAHISWYQLTIEPNTAFHHSPPLLPPDETIWSIQEQGEKVLELAGYEQYEVSAYAKRGLRCRHNLNYWRFGDYLGIGAGAHGKITNHTANAITRYWKFKQPQQYMERAMDASAGRQSLEAQDAAFEFMLNALRLQDGFTVGMFESATGLQYQQVASMINQAQEQGLLESVAIDAQKASSLLLRPTALGRRFLNDLTGLFLPAKGLPDAKPTS